MSHNLVFIFSFKKKDLPTQYEIYQNILSLSCFDSLTSFPSDDKQQ